MKLNKKHIPLLFCVFYTVGIGGYLWPVSRPWFIAVTPFSIAGSLILVLFLHPKWDRGSVVCLLVTAAMGFFIEYAGVHTGLLFGRYHYGATLGPGWQGIPWLIGLNWAAMVYYSQAVMHKWAKYPIAPLIGALLMTLYDFLLEPSAIAYDFWQWDNGTIPMQNYIAWFICSGMFHFLYQRYGKPVKNPVAAKLFWIQAAFFGLLWAGNLLLPA
ncbi:MAG: carotenoid biosynthesis protein [Bacteroidetes bacterium]|nr:carotenoid biosynthesis protein [Bacteroidota bacterium]